MQTTRLITAAGVYPAVTAEEYHADPCAEPSLSNSLSKEMLNRSPLHAWTNSRRLNPDWQPRDTKTFDIGRAAHRAVLGAGVDYAVIPEALLSDDGGIRTKEARAWVAEARDAGLTPVKQREAEQVEAMAAKLAAKIGELGLLIDSGETERVAVAKIDGVWCRMMADWVPAHAVTLPGLGRIKVIVDYKTAEDASPQAARRSVERWGYDVQDQWYSEVWHAATGEARAFLFFVQEKEPPFEVTVNALLREPGHSGDWSEDSAQKTAAARAMWGECLRTGHWPGYPAGLNIVPSRAFFRQDWQDSAQALMQASKPTREALMAARAFMAPTQLAGE